LEDTIQLIEDMLEDGVIPLAVAIVNHYVNILFPSILEVFSKHQAEAHLGAIIESRIDQTSGEFILKYILEEDNFCLRSTY
jgi:hypothetical protein